MQLRPAHPPRALPLLLTCACVLRPLADTATDGSSTGSTTEVDATGDPPAPTTSTDPTTGTTTGTTGVTCEGYTEKYLVPLVTPHVMLVVDQSPAMSDPWDHDADPATPERPRWASVRAVLEDILPLSTADNFALGLARFPDAGVTDEYGAQACTSEPAAILAPVTDNTDAILAALAPADATLVGAAPLRPAIAGALARLEGVDPELPRALVVITASAPNCAADAPDLDALLETLDPGALELVDAAALAGTFVFFVFVGVTDQPNPDAPDMRPDGVSVAAAYGVQFGVSLNAEDEHALSIEIERYLTDQTDKSCFVLLSQPPGPDQHIAGVRVAGQSVAGPVEDCETDEGWSLVGDAEIVLCGLTCKLFHDTGDLEIDVACDP